VVTCPPIEEQLASSCDVQKGTALFKKLKAVEIEYPETTVENDEYADEDGNLFSNICVYTVV